jgi:hypothetical protein
MKWDIRRAVDFKIAPSAGPVQYPHAGSYICPVDEF